MAVTKRQREKSVKREQKKNLRTSGETNTPSSWLALICIGQAQQGEDKRYKKREPRQVGASPLGLAPSHLKGVLSFVY